MGTIAGGFFALLLTVPIALLALSDEVRQGANPMRLVYTFACAFLPLAIALVVVFVGSIIIGLPTSYVLVRMRSESPYAYAAVGAFFGFLLPYTLAVATNSSDLMWLVILLGCFSGSVTGWTWGRSREERNFS